MPEHGGDAAIRLRPPHLPLPRQPHPGLVRELRERRFPATHRELAAECAAERQRKPAPLTLHYGPADRANPHQDLYGDIVFPLQIAIMLSRPGGEFEGEESVFAEQRPRSQSR